MMLTGSVLVVLVSVISFGWGLEMAKIQNSQGQALTSSTLQWVDLQSGQTPPENALRVSPDGPFWCRANQRGTMAAGAVQDGQCSIPFLGRVFPMPEYDVLVSINGSARIVEAEWDRLQAMPDNGITTPHMILAVTVNEDGQVLPGYVSGNERRAYFLKDGGSLRQDSAKILTEIEPTTYKVDHVVRNEEKSVLTKTEDVVATTNLSNAEKSVQPISEMLDYAAKEIIYWGRIRGTITGLQSTVVDPAGNQKDITWGIENELDHYEQQLVEYELPGEASVDVKLVAVMEKYEAPYSAMLTSFYGDGVQRTHPISGLHIHTRLAELRADFSQPYFTENKTEIAGEYIPSQILIHSTTTTTTTTTTTAPPNTASGSDGEKPQSDSLATSQSGGNTRPVAEQMSGANNNNVVSMMLSFTLGILLIHQLPFMY